MGSYFSVIRAIAAGNSKLSAIASVLETKSTNLTKYLKTLIEKRGFIIFWRNRSCSSAYISSSA